MEDRRCHRGRALTELGDDVGCDPTEGAWGVQIDHLDIDGPHVRFESLTPPLANGGDPSVALGHVQVRKDPALADVQEWVPGRRSREGIGNDGRLYRCEGEEVEAQATPRASSSS